MALTRKKTAPKPAATGATPTTPTQSRYFVRHSHFAIGPGANMVAAFGNLLIDGVRNMPDKEVEQIAVKVYRFRSGKLVVVREVTRPKTKASGYRGQIALPKDREGDYTLLDELFSCAVESGGFQAPTATLKALLESWVAEHGHTLTGDSKLRLARAFTTVIAARAGVNIAEERR